MIIQEIPDPGGFPEEPQFCAQAIARHSSGFVNARRQLGRSTGRDDFRSSLHCGPLSPAR